MTASNMYGICNLSAVPCRKEPSDKSEMVTQLLFGEHFQLLDTKGSWQLIRIAYDGYECWIDKKQFLPVSDSKGISNATTAISTEIVQLVEDKKNGIIPVVLGSSLPKFKDKYFFLGKQEYLFEGDTIFPFGKSKSPSLPAGRHGFGGVEEAARWYLNTPYLWGGRSPFGIDCSGFTQMVFKLNGIKLKRDAWQQAEQGEALSFLEESQTGDLAFFDNEEGKIVHVGIILQPPLPPKGGTQSPPYPPKGGNIGGDSSQIPPSGGWGGYPFGGMGGLQIIHASGKVRIDKLDHHGIYNEEMKKYTHRLRVVKRFM